MNFIVLIIVFLATFLGNIAGIGGGIIMKPAFDAFNVFSASMVGFYSSFIVLSTTSVSCYMSYKDKSLKIDHKIINIMIGSFFGGYIGNRLLSQTFNLFGDGITNAIQSILLIIMLCFVIYGYYHELKYKSKYTNNIVFITSIGIVLGLVSTYLGIGGGPLNILVFISIFHMDIKEATICSILTIFVAQIINIITYLFTININLIEYSTLFLMILIGITGGILGKRVMKRIQPIQIKRIFICLMITVIIINILIIFKDVL